MKNTKLYHYTPEFRLEEIIESGEIRLATESVVDLKREKACAWASSNPHWEETATKLFVKDGITTQLTFKEQLANFGCGRIEVKSVGFTTWGKLKYLAKMNLIAAKTMEETGIKRGGNPKEWFGSLEPIKSDKWIKAEVYKNGEWIEYKSFNQ
jgi:hypothetical protein